MAIEVEWLQNVTYPARLDRAVIGDISSNVDRVTEGLSVGPTGPASFDLEIQPGRCFVVGDDQLNQGSYSVGVTALETITVGATPGAARTDLLVLQIRDPQAGGGVGDDAVLAIAEGTTTPPPSSIPLATIDRDPGESNIGAAAITDVRPGPAFALWGQTGTSAPSGQGVAGDVFIQYGGT